MYPATPSEPPETLLTANTAGPPGTCASSTSCRTWAPQTAAREAPPDTATMIGRTGPCLGAQASAHCLKKVARLWRGGRSASITRTV